MDKATQREELELRDRQAGSYYEILLKSHSRGRYWFFAQTALVIDALQLDATTLSIYDVGSGVGLFALEIAKRFPHAQMLCVDFSAESLRILESESHKRNLHNITVKAGNVVSFQPDLAFFDRAMCIEVLQHLPDEESRLTALKRIFTALKVGGRFVTVNYRWGGLIRPPTPKEDNEHGGIKFTRCAFTETEMTHMLEKTGFRNVRAYGIIRFPPSRIRRILPSWSAAHIERFLIRTGLRSSDAHFVLATGEKL